MAGDPQHLFPMDSMVAFLMNGGKCPPITMLVGDERLDKRKFVPNQNQWKHPTIHLLGALGGGGKYICGCSDVLGGIAVALSGIDSGCGP